MKQSPHAMEAMVHSDVDTISNKKNLLFVFFVFEQQKNPLGSQLIFSRFIRLNPCEESSKLYGNLGDCKMHGPGCIEKHPSSLWPLKVFDRMLFSMEGPAK